MVCPIGHRIPVTGRGRPERVLGTLRGFFLFYVRRLALDRRKSISQAEMIEPKGDTIRKPRARRQTRLRASIRRSSERYGRRRAVGRRVRRRHTSPEAKRDVLIGRRGTGWLCKYFGWRLRFLLRFAWRRPGRDRDDRPKEFHSTRATKMVILALKQPQVVAQYERGDDVESPQSSNRWRNRRCRQKRFSRKSSRT